MRSDLNQHSANLAPVAGKPDSVDCYVYYRVRTEQAADLHMRVAAMQTHLLAESGVAGALKRRPLPQDGRHTWMEVYLAAPPDFDAMLAAAAAAAKLPELIDGERHVEHFLDVTSCGRI